MGHGDHEPHETPPCRRAAVIPPECRRLFWDCQPDRLDLETHAPFILERILEYGSPTSVRWAMEVYGSERIKRFLMDRGWRTLSRKTLAFWVLILHLDDEPCFERSSLTSNRPFWNY